MRPVLPLTMLLVLGGCAARQGSAPDAPPTHAGAATVFDGGYVRSFMLDVAPGEVMLIDAGNDKEARPIKAELARRQLTPAAVKTVLLTHAHPDHLNGCVAFPEAKLFALESEVGLIEGKTSARSPMARSLGWLLALTRPRLEVSFPLQDQQELHLGDLTVKVHAVPGHTDGSAVFQIGDMLFLGDCVSARKDGSLGSPPWFFSNDVAEGDRSRAALVTRLRPEAPRIHWLLPSHSGPMEGFQALEAGLTPAR